LEISFALDVHEVDIEVAEVTVVVEVATVETEEILCCFGDVVTE
jgi:hypothetical protein